MSLRFSIATEAATCLTAVAARFGREGIVKELAMGRKAAPQRDLESLSDALSSREPAYPPGSRPEQAPHQVRGMFRAKRYSLTGTQISNPPLPVSGSKFSS